MLVHGHNLIAIVVAIFNVLLLFVVATLALVLICVFEQVVQILQIHGHLEERTHSSIGTVVVVTLLVLLQWQIIDPVISIVVVIVVNVVIVRDSDVQVVFVVIIRTAITEQAELGIVQDAILLQIRRGRVQLASIRGIDCGRGLLQWRGTFTHKRTGGVQADLDEIATDDAAIRVEFGDLEGEER